MNIYLSEYEIFQIAYLASKGWKPDVDAYSTIRPAWTYNCNNASGRTAWFLDIGEAYNCQLQWEKEDEKCLT